jgi:hypothetical protein
MQNIYPTLTAAQLKETKLNGANGFPIILNLDALASTYVTRNGKWAVK